MLDAIGVDSIDALFDSVPEGVRLGRAAGAAARQAGGRRSTRRLRDLAARNTSTEDEISFLGAGMYDHYVPSLIDSILSRSEFLTPYTPYQPEISQGGLQVMFEYQTAISELTGLPVSNASVYEGPSALAAAAYLAKLHNKRTRFLVSAGVHPHARETLETTSAGWGTTIEEIPLTDGVTDVPEIGDDVSAVLVQYPNFYGAVEDLQALTDAAHEAGALMIVLTDPLTLGVLKPPGEFGVDVAVGEGQTLGNRLDYGGPSFGFFAAQETYLRRMPGRIAGETTDVDGRRGFVLTLQTREQHIRREKATHNICTAQALNALAGVIYLSWLGRRGPRRARRAAAPAHRLRPRSARGARRRRAAARAAGRARVRGQARRARRRGHRALRRRGRQPRLPARGRRPADRDHRAAQPRGHRPARARVLRRRRRGGARGGDGVSAVNDNACTPTRRSRADSPQARPARSSRRRCSATAR